MSDQNIIIIRNVAISTYSCEILPLTGLRLYSSWTDIELIVSNIVIFRSVNTMWEVFFISSFFHFIIGCSATNLGPLHGRQPHSLHFNHCFLI